MIMLTSILLLIAVPFVQSCGISTHVEIGHMAATMFHDWRHNISYKQLIMKHQDAFQAGNTYPDTYYTSVCFSGQYHDVSEDTHWTPFTNVTIEYIRSNFPPPWSDEAEKLIVFMLGFVSHQVADITWHSLGIRQGFIRTMAAVDFHGVYDTSHSAADLGADVINEYRGDYSYIHFNQWYVPVQHLYKIYQLYYGSMRVPLNVIEDCTTLIYLAVLGEKIALSKIYMDTAIKSPFLTQNLDSFFLGGMYDMALWSTNIWDDVLYILENGFSDYCSTPRNPLYMRCGSPDRKYSNLPKVAVSHTSKSSQLVYQHSLTRDDIIVERTKYGIILKPSNITLQKQELMKEQKRKQAPTKAESSKVRSPSTILSIHGAYARFGEVVLTADVNNDGLDDLVISAPMYSEDNQTDYEGKLFLLYGSETGLPKGDFAVEDIANDTIEGPAVTSGRFGSGVAVLDMNLDGFNDIVASVPNSQWDNLTYIGYIALWLGNKSGKFPGTPDRVHMNAKAPLFNNEGVHLFSEDIDGDGYKDLIINSPYAPGPAGPQSGKLCFIQSSKDLNFNISKCIYGPGLAANTSWFGSSVVVGKVPEVGHVLIASSPLYRLCSLPSCEFSVNDIQSAGQITIWSLPDLKLLRAINGTKEHEHFGSSLALGYPYGRNESVVLAVGMDSVDVNGSLFGFNDTYKQVGAVAMWNLTTLLSHTEGPVSLLYGDRQFSMFGSEAKFSDLDGDGIDELLVGAPHYTEDPTEIIEGAEQGLVTIFGGQASVFPSEDIGVNTCGSDAIVPCTTKVASQLLKWSENKAHVGGRLAVLSPPKGLPQVVVSALRSSHLAHRSGAVLIY